MNRSFSRLRVILVYLLGFAAIFSLFFVDIAKESLFGKYGKGQEPNRVQNAVRFFNKALEKTILESRPDYLDEYATYEIKKNMGLQIYYEQREKKMKLESKLLSLDFVKEELKGRQATVWTKEVWENIYYDVNNKKRIIIPKEKTEYEIKYTLKKERNNWRVNKIDILKEKRGSI